MENDEIDDAYLAKTRQLIERARTEGRYPYVMPVNRIDKAALCLKVICVGHGLGVIIPKDVIFALGIKKAQLIELIINAPSQSENPIKIPITTKANQ